MQAGVEPKCLPMSQTRGEKGIDLALAIDALQIGLKQGVRVLGAYFKFEAKNGKKSYINERLLSVVNYAVDVNTLESDKEHKQAFKSLFRKSAEFEE
jgi:hypothetical protein